MVTPHDQRVPVLLTADEYLFARDEAERRGMSISAYFRWLLAADRRHVALGKLSTHERYEKSADAAQDHAQEIGVAVSAAVVAALSAYQSVRNT